MEPPVLLATVRALLRGRDAELALRESEARFRTMADAAARFTWPREREALDHIRILLGTGDAGFVEDVDEP